MAFFGNAIHIFVAKFGQKFTFLFLKVPMGGGGSTGLGIIPKKKQFFYCFPKMIIMIDDHGYDGDDDDCDDPCVPVFRSPSLLTC